MVRLKSKLYVELFGELGIDKIIAGSRFLGGYVGDRVGQEEYVRSKVQDWALNVTKLIKATTSQPQAAYAVLVKSLQHEWAFIQRVIPTAPSWFECLKEVIWKEFWPSLFGSEVTEDEASLFTLPTRMGGMGVRDPTKSVEMSYEASKSGSSQIIEKITGREEEFSVADHYIHFVEAGEKRRLKQRALDDQSLNTILTSMDELKVRAIKRSINGKCSNWLNVIPVSRYGFVLSGREFRDAIALRYRRPLMEMPGRCDGCDAPTDVSHALSCRRGGLLIRRHNEVRDSLGDLLAMGFNSVLKEPIVKEGDIYDSNNPGLVADLAVRGLWQPQTDVLFDVRVVDTDALSHCHRPVRQVIRSAEDEKKLKYLEAVEERRGSFTPFVVSVDGYLGQEADKTLRRVADVLVYKWEKNYSLVINWVRAYMTFSIIRATDY